MVLARLRLIANLRVLFDVVLKGRVQMSCFPKLLGGVLCTTRTQRS